MRTTRILISSIFSILMVLATIASASAGHTGETTVAPTSQDDTSSFTPGKLPTVKGNVEVLQNDPSRYLNPNRPSRTLSYFSAPRQSYRAGRVDYYDRTRELRELSRPVLMTGVQSIAGKRQGNFIKNVPSIYPYPTDTSLRQRISNGRTSMLARSKIKTTSSSIIAPEGGDE